MNYKFERIVDGPHFPICANDNPDWTQLFENNNCDPWLTPRMAMKIHDVALGLDTTNVRYWRLVPAIAESRSSLLQDVRKMGSGLF
jgi:hypothetical protein